VGSQEEFYIDTIYETLRPMRSLTVSLGITNSQGIPIFYSHEGDSTDWESRDRPIGRYHSRCVIPGGLLKPGFHFVSVKLYVENVEIIDRHDDIIALEVSNSGSPAQDGRTGVISPILQWQVRHEAPCPAASTAGEVA
jgi:lipopolysaccharide transport system ATP-binding protein